MDDPFIHVIYEVLTNYLHVHGPKKTDKPIWRRVPSISTIPWPVISRKGRRTGLQYKTTERTRRKTEDTDLDGRTMCAPLTPLVPVPRVSKDGVRPGKVERGRVSSRTWYRQTQDFTRHSRGWRTVRCPCLHVYRPTPVSVSVCRWSPRVQGLSPSLSLQLWSPPYSETTRKRGDREQEPPVSVTFQYFKTLYDRDPLSISGVLFVSSVLDLD